MKRWNPVTGEKVVVCYDGKLGRFEIGHITRVQGCFIQVHFFQVNYIETDDKGYECFQHIPMSGLFPRLSDRHYGRFIKENEQGVMRMLGCTKGDWYSVYPLSELNVWKIKKGRKTK